MRVLVCMAMDKLLGRPQGPCQPSLPSPSMGTWVPGLQFSWFPALQSPAFPSHSPQSQPSPWADVLAQPGLSLSLSRRKWPMPRAGLPPSCPAPWLGWWEICCPVMPLCFSAQRRPHSAESCVLPKKMGKHIFAPSTPSDEWDFW